jgi:hypothetical protein
MRGISIATAVAVLGFVAGTSPASAATPALRVEGTQPFVVRGVAFRPLERVALTAMTPLGPKRVLVRATRLGRFAATFRVGVQPCGSAVALRAVGARGSRVTLRLPSLPCIPPPIR